MGGQAGGLEHDGAVHVADLPGRRHLGHDPSQQAHAVGAGPGLVVGGKVAAEVTEPRRAEEGVGHGVGNDVGIAVPGQPRSLEGDAAEHQPAGRVVA